VVQRTARRGPTVSRAREDAQRPHALIVSDDAELATFLSEGLTIGGFWTSVIASGIQTLEVLRLRTFDIGLMDVALSGMGALEVIRRVRGANGLADRRSDLPILLIADSLEQLGGRTAPEVGVEAVILPPLEIEQLALDLFRVVRDWRASHPGREWADRLAQAGGDQ
jgi:CheY-like chemotaxis protein